MIRGLGDRGRFAMPVEAWLALLCLGRTGSRFCGRLSGSLGFGCRLRLGVILLFLLGSGEFLLDLQNGRNEFVLFEGRGISNPDFTSFFEEIFFVERAPGVTP